MSENPSQTSQSKLSQLIDTLLENYEGLKKRIKELEEELKEKDNKIKELEDKFLEMEIYEEDLAAKIESALNNSGI